MGPLMLEVMAQELVRYHQAEAAQARLAAQLPRRSRSVATATATAAARHHLARGLRQLAARLDPSLSPTQSRLAPAGPR